MPPLDTMVDTKNNKTIIHFTTEADIENNTILHPSFSHPTKAKEKKQYQREDDDNDNDNDIYNEEDYGILQQSLLLEDDNSETDNQKEKDQDEEQKSSNKIFKLLFAVSGIYGTYMYYGSLQEDVFRYETSDGKKFHYAWFLHAFEAFINVVFACIGRCVFGGTKGLPLRLFFLSGAAQLIAKGMTSLSLAYGLSFPVAMLCKSAKMAPVMLGQLLLSGSTYRYRDYVQTALIIGGTVLLRLGTKKTGVDANSTIIGITCILLSLLMEGVTAGLQQRLKVQMKQIGKKPTSYDFMLFSNISMMIVALFIACVTPDLTEGYSFVQSEPELRTMLLRFCVCSAVGQSFIFYTIAHFDPLVCTTITTTRKISSVLLSILIKGHVLLRQGWVGVAIAVIGIIAEIQGKFEAASTQHTKKLQQNTTNNCNNAN